MGDQIRSVFVSKNFWELIDLAESNFGNGDWHKISNRKDTYFYWNLHWSFVFDLEELWSTGLERREVVDVLTNLVQYEDLIAFVCVLVIFLLFEVVNVEVVNRLSLINDWTWHFKFLFFHKILRLFFEHLAFYAIVLQ